MNQNQKSTRDHIVKDDDPTYQRQNSIIIKQLPEFTSIQQQESVTKAWMQRMDGEKVFG